MLNRRFLGLVTSVVFVSGCASTPAPQGAPTQDRPMEMTTPPISESSDGTRAPKKNEAKPETPAPSQAANPPPAQSITISVEQISGELGVPQQKLENQVRVLAHFLDHKRASHGLCAHEDDEDGSSDKLCSLVDLIENNPAVARSRREGGRRVPIRPQHFGEQQGMAFSRLSRSLAHEPVNRVMVWAPRMLATTSCPRNLSAAALRRLEVGLPMPSVRYMMEKLYAHAAACLRPQDEAYEITHLRQGLLRLQAGNKAGAKVAFEKAVLAQETADRPRSLYWAGRMQATAAAQKIYWDKLVEEFPLSFHSLEVWRHRSQDPLQIFESRPPLTLTRHIDNEDIDNAMRWLEALYVYGHVETAQKLARWINSTYKDELPPSTAFYISALKSNRGNSLNSITFLTQQVNENPRMLNQQTLRLLFPRPFFDVFERNCKDTDTSLVLGVARQESGFNPSAHSTANAQGLLQLLPSTARRLSGKRRNNLYDSDVNAQLGVKYLSSLIERFHSVELALAAYNAGPGHINEWTARYGTSDSTLFMDLIPFKETRHYVANIVRNNYWYERLYSSENAASRSLASTTKARQRSNLVSRLVEAHLSARQQQIQQAKIIPQEL